MVRCPSAAVFPFMEGEAMRCARSGVGGTVVEEEDEEKEAVVELLEAEGEV